MGESACPAEDNWTSLRFNRPAGRRFAGEELADLPDCLSRSRRCWPIPTRGRGALAGLLRKGNAGSNTAADHITVLDQALASLPSSGVPPPTPTAIRRWWCARTPPGPLISSPRRAVIAGSGSPSGFPSMHGSGMPWTPSTCYWPAASYALIQKPTHPDRRLRGPLDCSHCPQPTPSSWIDSYPSWPARPRCLLRTRGSYRLPRMASHSLAKRRSVLSVMMSKSLS